MLQSLEVYVFSHSYSHRESHFKDFQAQTQTISTRHLHVDVPPTQRLSSEGTGRRARRLLFISASATSDMSAEPGVTPPWV